MTTKSLNEEWAGAHGLQHEDYVAAIDTASAEEVTALLAGYGYDPAGCSEQQARDGLRAHFEGLYDTTILYPDDSGLTADDFATLADVASDEQVAQLLAELNLPAGSCATNRAALSLAFVKTYGLGKSKRATASLKEQEGSRIVDRARGKENLGTSKRPPLRRDPPPAPEAKGAAKLPEAAAATKLSAGRSEADGEGGDVGANSTADSTYTLEQLQDRGFCDGHLIPAAEKWLHLSDSRFTELFGRTKEQYSALPKWKQGPLKKKAGLF